MKLLGLLVQNNSLVTDPLDVQMRGYTHAAEYKKLTVAGITS